MRKKFRLEDLDCAHCAAKMEENIRKLNGVTDISVNFMSEKLIIETDDSCDFDALMDQVQTIIAKIEPDCTLVR